MKPPFLTRLWRCRRVRWLAVGGAVAALIIGFTLPHWLPRLLAAFRDDIVFRVPEAGHQVFLTIDDGPSPATDQILAVLAKHDATATFFITGNHVSNPAQLAAIRTGGHAIAHHQKTTRRCSSMTQEEFTQDFAAVDALLQEAGGVRLFRPSSDFGTREQIAHAHAEGYRTVVGTVFPLDHWLENPRTIRQLAGWLAIDGGIIILHDGAARGPRTAQVLNELIPKLKRRGFAFGDLATELNRAKTRK